MEDLEEREALDNAGLLENSDDDSEDRAYKQTDAEEMKIPEGRDVESSGESDVETDKKSLFINPLARKAAGLAAEESEEWSEDDDYSDGGKKSKKKKGNKKDKDATVLGKRKRKGDIDNV